MSRPPLAERLRPQSFDEVVGQPSVLGPGGVIPKLLADGRPPSLILWGPPGCGKTTVGRLVAQSLRLTPVVISAVTSGVKELKSIFAESEQTPLQGPTLLFVDEIHRFNRAQQDAFLGPVESGSIILLGATTENPSFQLNAALLSRCRVVVLEALDREALRELLHRALRDEPRGVGALQLELTSEAEELLLDVCDGDARALLTDLEWVTTGLVASPGKPLDVEQVQQSLGRRLPRMDRAGDEHFNLVSALHKSIRASHPQAALYWLARMLEGGEDPLYVARRLIRIASEDIGLADPQALPMCVAARDAVHTVGLPEGALALAQAAVYLATAPKSDRLYRGYAAACAEVQKSGSLPVPLDVRNAPTRLMKELGYGQNYRSAHDDVRGMRLQYLPDELAQARFYQPKELGFEREILKRMQYFEKQRRPADDGDRE